MFNMSKQPGLIIKDKPKIRGEYDSEEEKWFDMYLKELETLGIVTVNNLVYSYVIFEGFPKHLGRTKPKVYTPDFVFKFDTDSPLSKVLKPSKDGYVYVDVKGAFTRNLTSSITFSDRQAMMWDNHGIYINKVIPHSNKVSKVNKTNQSLFCKTFVPKAFKSMMIYKTTKSKGLSKIKYESKTYEEYMELQLRKDTKGRP